MIIDPAALGPLARNGGSPGPIAVVALGDGAEWRPADVDARDAGAGNASAGDGGAGGTRALPGGA